MQLVESAPKKQLLKLHLLCVTAETALKQGYSATSVWLRVKG